MPTKPPPDPFHMTGAQSQERYRQLGLDELTRQLRDDGIARAAEHAGETWVTHASRLFDEYIRRRPLPTFTSGDLIAWAHAAGLPEPPTRRAWGSVFTAAKKSGVIVCVGFVAHPDPKRHGAPCRVWRRAHPV